jgi:hypothetical protein
METKQLFMFRHLMARKSVEIANSRNLKGQKKRESVCVCVCLLVHSDGEEKRRRERGKRTVSS